MTDRAHIRVHAHAHACRKEDHVLTRVCILLSWLTSFLYRCVVEHGFSGPKDPLLIVGYRFEQVAYLSDVSHIPAESMRALEGVQILIIDALHPIGSYSSHFCFPQAVQVIKTLKPAFVYLTGLSHAWTHDTANAKLAALCSTDPELAGISIQLAFDGLRLLLE